MAANKRDSIINVILHTARDTYICNFWKPPSDQSVPDACVCVCVCCFVLSHLIA